MRGKETEKMNALVFAAAIAAATNLTTTAELPVVIVEASRLDRTTRELPQAVQTLSGEQITRSGAQNLPDLLHKAAPQIHVSGLSGMNPAQQQLSMGGYGENGFGRTLITVDGERLNNPDMSAPNLSQVNLSSVRRVEILSGPQSVLHGDGASAGVINIITEPEGYDSHGYAEIRGGSWNTFGASLGYSGGCEETGTQYWADGAWTTSDGYRDNSSYSIWNATAGVKQNFTNGAYLKFSSFYNYADYDLPRALSRAGWKSHPRHSVQKDARYPTEETDYFKRETFGFNATAYGVVDEENSVRLTTTFSRRHSKSGTFGNGSYDNYDYKTGAYLGVMDYVWTSRMDYDMYSYAVKPEWINTTEFNGYLNEFLLGLETTYDRLTIETSAPTYYYPRYAAPFYRDPFDSDALIDRLTMSFYAQDTFHLSEALALQLGARYERAWNRYSAAVNPHQARHLNAYEAAILFTPIEPLKTYVRVTRFFRSPFLDENPYNGGRKALRILNPETGWNSSLGGEYRLLEEFTLAADLFASRTQHEIFFNPFYAYNADWGSWTKDNVNSPSPVNRWGFQTAASWEREKVAGLTLGYSFVNAEFDGGEYDGRIVPLIPESTVSLSGRVWLWDDCFIFGGYRYQSEQYSSSDFKNNLPTIPAFGLFHVGVSYAPSYAALKGWKASLTIDNLFDKNYCNYATYGENYWPGSGRSLLVTLAYAF